MKRLVQTGGKEWNGMDRIIKNCANICQSVDSKLRNKEKGRRRKLMDRITKNVQKLFDYIE